MHAALCYIAVYFFCFLKSPTLGVGRTCWIQFQSLQKRFGGFRPKPGTDAILSTVFQTFHILEVNSDDTKEQCLCIGVTSQPFLVAVWVYVF